MFHRHPYFGQASEREAKGKMSAGRLMFQPVFLTWETEWSCAVSGWLLHNPAAATAVTCHYSMTLLHEKHLFVMFSSAFKR